MGAHKLAPDTGKWAGTGALGQVSMRAQKGVFEPPSGVEKRALPTSPVNMPNAGALAENKCKGRAPHGGNKKIRTRHMRQNGSTRRPAHLRAKGAVLG